MQDLASAPEFLKTTVVQREKILFCSRNSVFSWPIYRKNVAILDKINGKFWLTRSMHKSISKTSPHTESDIPFSDKGGE
ncbi:hypothetical protein LKK83_05650 [Phormidium sp. CCY1219]|nr:hypothetical protein [Phormidium sp. CCY1219]